MAGDRDLNVALLVAWAARHGRIERAWEMLAATGVRGLRGLHESRALVQLDLTEAHPAAFAVLAANVARYREDGATPHHRDARDPPPAPPYGYVDLDPYGSPLAFLDAAFVAAGGDALIAVTATDTRVLAGADRGVAERRYGGRPVRGRLGTEGGLRLLLATLARHAAARGAAVRPVLCYVGDHHVRAYVHLAPAPDGSPAVRALDPATWEGPPVGRQGPYGPLWLGPLFDGPLVRDLAVPPTAADPSGCERMIRLLRAETAVDRPFYYEGNTLAERLHLDRPPSVAQMTTALAAIGRRVVPTHARPGAFRTDATDAEVVAAAGSVRGQSQNDRVRA
jgi:tRNA (guanine26-N2/guanine27-N2)-dimethyltransferase